MHELQFSVDVLNRIRAQGDGYHERAYLFMLAAIEYLQTQYEVRRHVTGSELSWACRDFAVRQFGLLAEPVLEPFRTRRKSTARQPLLFKLHQCAIYIGRLQEHDGIA